MANIRVDLKHTPRDGEPVSFKAPCDASNITGLSIYYMNAAGETESQEFALTDANGGDIGVIDRIFAEGAIVKVLLDTDTNRAFVQNADTNAYLEGRFDGISFNGRKGAVMPQNGDYTAAMVGAAPAGYGLGVVQPEKISEERLNSILPAGRYGYEGTIEGSQYFTIISDPYNPSYYHQTAINIWNGSVLHRYYVQEFAPQYPENNGFTPWEWENPPMVEGKEYRTTERYNGKVVYQKLVQTAGTFPVSGGKAEYEILPKGCDIIYAQSCLKGGGLTIPYEDNLSGGRKANVEFFVNFDAAQGEVGSKWVRLTATANNLNTSYALILLKYYKAA